MATLSQNSGSVTDKILVKGIPSALNADKLTIYFQKRKIGGGDVASVTFPLSSKEPDAAIIIFDEAETVQSVLKKDHTIGGKEVVVTALQPQPTIFEKVTAEVSKFVIQHIKSKNKSTDDVFEYVMDSTGCVINGSGQSYSVSGEWYQVQAAFERFESIVAENLTINTPTSTSPLLNGYLSRTPSQTLASPVPVSRSSVPVGNPSADARISSTMKEKVDASTTIDKDLYAYLQLMHGNDIESLKKQFNTDFKCTLIGDAAKVSAIPLTNDTDTSKAIKTFEELSQRIAGSISQDTVEIDSKRPLEVSEKIFSQLRPEFPRVHMDNVHDSPNVVLFSAPDANGCRMAKEMFNHFLQREAAVLADAGSGDEKNKISIDKDIFAFVELTRKDELQKIWDSNEVTIRKNTVGDCTEIVVSPKSVARRPNVQAAIDMFQKIYGQANDTAYQRNFDLTDLSRKAAVYEVNEAIRKVKQRFHDVHIDRIVVDNQQILFIANGMARCGNAVEYFMSLLCSKQ